MLPCLQNPRTRPGLDTRTIDDEMIVLDVARQRIHRLNPTASFIWQRCDGQHSSDDIMASLAAVHAVTIDRVAADVHRTLREFARLELIVASDDEAPSLSGE
jgi:hypothetical protein